MTAADVYAELGQFVKETTPSDWVKCLLRVERQDGSHEYDGTYLAEGAQFMSLVNTDLPPTLVPAVEELYRITTQGGNNEWNRLYFTLMPGGAFEVDFILNQDEEAGQEYLRSTRRLTEAKRREGYRALQYELAQARSNQLYENISQRLPALAAVVAPAWQRITLYVDRWNDATFKLRGFAQANNPQEEEEFNVTQDWSLVKEFYELSTMSYLPNWHVATWTVLPNGTYTIVFNWDMERNPRKPPRDYPFTHAGRWQKPA